MIENQKLNSLQLELLNIYSFEPEEEDLLAVKTLLARYFSGKLQKTIQKSIDEKQLTEEDISKWINE